MADEKKTYSGQIAQGPMIIIHGGAGSIWPEKTFDDCKAKINEIIETCFSELESGKSAEDVVTLAMEIFEACELYDAGRGSDLPRDGSPKLSAAIMNGESGRFAGAHLVEHSPFPTRVAKELLSRKHRVLGTVGCSLIAREIGLEVEVGPSDKQIDKWVEDRAKIKARETGTVGAVALDANGVLAAATSTGGTSNCYPGRMSDVGTVASTFASKFSATSGTGVGEEITESGCAVRLDTRVRDGQSIVEASDKLLKEASEQKQRFGWISVDAKQNWAAYYTTKQMVFGVKDSASTTIVINNAEC